MPHPNRVQPDGTFLAHAARGTLTGNRGILHDEARRIRPARWKHRAWICCALSFRGRHRDVMPPRRWTALFFLDEAVALAAGHRPCAECRRAAHARFAAAWETAHGSWPGSRAAGSMLHAARARPGARDLRHGRGAARTLPDGTFTMHEGAPLLLWEGRAWPYAPAGYGPSRPVPEGSVTILTNPVTRAVLAAGYRPEVHPSISRPSRPS